MTYVLDIPRLVEAYAAGQSVAALAREFGVDPSAVKRNLTVAGVHIRGSREATAASFAYDPGRRSRMGRPRVYPINPGYFDTLTPNGSYIVGLLQADGSNQVDRGIVCITLKGSDGPLLTAVATEMGAARPLRMNQNGGLKFEVQNAALSAGLARWGVVSPKTYTASTHPDLLRDRDYWRGVIDGDGSLCVGADGRRFLTLVGSRPICEQWLTFARSHGAGERVSVRPHKSIYSVHLSGQQAERMAAVLYADAGLALARKAAMARAWKVAA